MARLVRIRSNCRSLLAASSRWNVTVSPAISGHHGLPQALLVQSLFLQPRLRFQQGDAHLRVLHQVDFEEFFQGTQQRGVLIQQPQGRPPRRKPPLQPPGQHWLQAGQRPLYG